ncbi:MAG: hypothetical protein Q4P17_03960 [Methanobacterium sp.]|nr:hypothetical protein [Methanobacterium sp.]
MVKLKNKIDTKKTENIITEEFYDGESFRIRERLYQLLTEQKRGNITDLTVHMRGPKGKTDKITYKFSEKLEPVYESCTETEPSLDETESNASLPPSTDISLSEYDIFETAFKNVESICKNFVETLVKTKFLDGLYIGPLICENEVFLLFVESENEFSYSVPKDILLCNDKWVSFIENDIFVVEDIRI